MKHIVSSLVLVLGIVLGTFGIMPTAQAEVFISDSQYIQTGIQPAIAVGDNPIFCDALAGIQVVNTGEHPVLLRLYFAYGASGAGLGEKPITNLDLHRFDERYGAETEFVTTIALSSNGDCSVELLVNPGVWVYQINGNLGITDGGVFYLFSAGANGYDVVNGSYIYPYFDTNSIMRFRKVVQEPVVTIQGEPEYPMNGYSFFLHYNVLYANNAYSLVRIVEQMAPYDTVLFQPLSYVYNEYPYTYVSSKDLKLGGHYTLFVNIIQNGKWYEGSTHNFTMVAPFALSQPEPHRFKVGEVINLSGTSLATKSGDWLFTKISGNEMYGSVVVSANADGTTATLTVPTTLNTDGGYGKGGGGSGGPVVPGYYILRHWGTLGEANVFIEVIADGVPRITSGSAVVSVGENLAAAVIENPAGLVVLKRQSRSATVMKFTKPRKVKKEEEEKAKSLEINEGGGDF